MISMALGEQGNEIGSSSNHSGGEAAEETHIVIPRGMNMPSPHWLTDTTDEEVDHLKAEKDNLKKKLACKIQRVTSIFRELDSSGKNNYDPFIISLGPFHHGNPKLKRMEKLKTSMTRRFINGTQKSPEAVYSKFLEVARNAKTEYYVLEPKDDIYDDEEFLRILFVDVCFLIQFILARVAIDEYVAATNMTNHDIAYLPKDLFLLENQLPFPIVKALMMLRFSEDMTFWIIYAFIRDEVGIRPKRSPWHRRIRMMFLARKQAPEENIADSDPDVPLHLLHALQMQLSGPEKQIRESHGRTWYSYRSVKELKAAGIHFSPRSGYSRRLTDIRFHSKLIYGVLSLKPTVIDRQTEARFLNLCAFETLPDAPGDFWVTSYLCFMDSLINTAEDVQELKSRGILHNFLATDQLVADMFNDIAKELVPNPDAFVDVKSAIERHCSSRARTWFIEVLYKRFSAPNWTVIGFLFAAFAIALSIIQTFMLYKPHTSK